MTAFMVPERSQRILLTEIDLDTIAPPGSAVRIIDELVDSLDTSEIEKHFDVASEAGPPPFHPKTLVKVALLALHNCRFSLRKMEQDTTNHLAYRWLTGDKGVDHSTMGYFLARFRLESSSCCARWWGFVRSGS
jgi:transposase